MQPMLHVQNVFDALNPHGTGVSGYPKQRCLQLQNRVAALANPGDIIAVSADCSPAFIEYMLRTTGVSDVLTLRYQVNPDPRRYLDARSVFEALVCDPQWEAAKQRRPVLSPYMKSAAIYQAARTSGIGVSESEWEGAVRFTGRMNDKGTFYQECDKAGIPVPRHWLVSGKVLADCVTDLLETNHCPLYIRQTRSGGTLGNITAERIGSRYSIRELRTGTLSHGEFVQALQEFIETSFLKEFVLSELLDLYASPGTVFYADEVGVTVLCHTYQVMNRNRFFLGFTYPIKDEKITKHFGSIEKQVRLLVEPWRQLGYRGYGNIDWMITKDGDSFLAERNARQTGVISPLTIANACSGLSRRGSSIVAPPLSIFTRDIIDLAQAITFEETYAVLWNKSLLREQSKHGDGVVITTPPSPRLGINGVGIMAVGSNLPTAYEKYSQALHALGTQENELLFKLKI